MYTSAIKNMKTVFNKNFRFDKSKQNDLSHVGKVQIEVAWLGLQARASTKISDRDIFGNVFHKVGATELCLRD